MPNSFAALGVLSAAAYGGGNVVYKPGGCETMGTTPKSAEFNNPAKAIGTGPYKLTNYTRGSHVILERNDAYWGEKPHWRQVTWRPFTSGAPRVAALLSGDVDMIENPPIQDLERIKSSGFEISQGISNRVIYLHMDQFRGDPGWKTPGVRGNGQKSFPGQAGARGRVEGDQPAGDRGAHHGRGGAGGGRASAGAAVRHVARHEADGL